jgi:hypothetical protein
MVSAQQRHAHGLREDDEIPYRRSLARSRGWRTFAMKSLPILLSCVAGFCVGCGQKAEPTFHVNPDVPRPVLSAFGEPLLPACAAEKTNHIYRFTCLRSFNEPFCVVLTVTPVGTGSYVRKMATGVDRHPEVLKEKTEGNLTASQVDLFLKVVDRERFWTLDKTDPPDTMGYDGSTWIVEAVRDGKYHIVNRWSPGDGTPVGRIGRGLLLITEWNIEHLY